MTLLTVTALKLKLVQLFNFAFPPHSKQKYVLCEWSLNDSGALTNPLVILAYLRNTYLEKRNAIPMQK